MQSVIRTLASLPAQSCGEDMTKSSQQYGISLYRYSLAREDGHQLELSGESGTIIYDGLELDGNW